LPPNRGQRDLKLTREGGGRMSCAEIELKSEIPHGYRSRREAQPSVSLNRLNHFPHMRLREEVTCDEWWERCIEVGSLPGQGGNYQNEVTR
jgi:hypothetical protein